MAEAGNDVTQMPFQEIAMRQADEVLEDVSCPVHVEVAAEPSHDPPTQSRHANLQDQQHREAYAEGRKQVTVSIRQDLVDDKLDELRCDERKDFERECESKNPDESSL
jgi:hypothetical protein